MLPKQPINIEVGHGYWGPTTGRFQAAHTKTSGSPQQSRDNFRGEDIHMTFGEEDITDHITAYQSLKESLDIILDLDNKSHFINLLLRETWVAHAQGRRITFSLLMGDNGPTLVCKQLNIWKQKLK
jgi:hypothetical protein